MHKTYSHCCNPHPRLELLTFMSTKNALSADEWAKDKIHFPCRTNLYNNIFPMSPLHSSSSIPPLMYRVFMVLALCTLSCSNRSGPLNSTKDELGFFFLYKKLIHPFKTTYYHFSSLTNAFLIVNISHRHYLYFQCVFFQSI